MQPALLAPPVQSQLDPKSEEFADNQRVMLERLAEIDTLLGEAEAGGGPESHARLLKRGKLAVRERIALALDPDSPFL
ncbi:MAG TPA: acyl-CoA carboxylase subunit beta, partial [Myxococcales bacterium]|nr:acyl-CoA carboxylase subunit beta [Myxococcales bacterium]